MIKNTKLINLFITSLFLLTFILLVTTSIVTTNARYLNRSDSNYNVKVATWNFKVNGSDNSNLTISLDDTLDKNNLYNTNKVVPGSYGVIPINIDCNGSKVSIVYSIKLNNSNLPSNLKFYTDSSYTTLFDGFDGEINYDGEQILNKNIYWKWTYTTEDETGIWSDADLNANFIIDAKQKVSG